MRVWIFDLDDTLHNASAHIFPEMNGAMTKYIKESLDIDDATADQLRKHYWKIYGATLKGLMRHHGTNPHHFLNETHKFPDLAERVIQTKRLRHTLTRLKGRKVIFTNAPRNYALRVLGLLGISDIFDLVFSVESSGFHAKPTVRGFQTLLRTIKARPNNCIMLEDNLAALMTAKRIGIKTIWVNRKLSKPNFVDFRLSSVSALPHLRL
ncbi:MAG: pyrimidine 5'-nucleotidase [Methylophilaceae bacterium]